MKILIAIFAIAFSMTTFASQVLLTCDTRSLKDLVQVTVSEEDNFLTLTQTLSNGEVHSSKLSWNEFENKDIRIYGKKFRHLINDFDTNNEWMVHEYEPGYDALVRVQCIEN